MLRALATVCLAAAALLVAVGPAHAAPAAVGSLAGGVTFSQDCSSGIGVGLTYDGTNLWYSCYRSSPDLLRADPRTGQVTASYNIAGGLGALAYDATHNVIWAGWGNSDIGDIRSIGLDSGKNYTASAVVFNTCPKQCFEDIDDGLAYDAQATSLFVSEDTSQVITNFTLNGGVISEFPWAGTGGCYNSGVALGNQLIFEGADGCNHVYVVDKSNPSVVLYDFPTAIAGDPNFRDEGLTCDTDTFAGNGEQVMWSKEAYSPMRAHAFVIPDGSCGVGGNSAPGTTTPPPGFSGPLPLIIAHGITGTADGEQTLEKIAQKVVPGLAQPGFTLRTATGAVSSVWDNGNTIADDAQNMMAATGAPNVNVIAHSKGGLDTRYAMYLAPWEFNDLGMLSTPNGGSSEADKLCDIRSLPLGGSVKSEFGACDSDKNGLFDLQTWYTQKVFDDLVRDNASLNYYDLGSNCSTAWNTFACNGADNAGLGCRDGGDEAVCLESAYWLTTTWPRVPGGLQTVVPPLSGFTHTEMNTDPCPISDMLAQLYPLDSVNNPWVNGDGSGCQDITPAAVIQPHAAAAPSATPATSGSSAAGAGTLVDQGVMSGGADPTHPFTASLDPEGGDTMKAVVYIPAGVTPTIAVTDPSGVTDPNAVITLNPATDGFGVQTESITLAKLSGATRTLTVTTDSSSAVGLDTQVASPVTMNADATAAANGTNNALVTATVGVAAAKAKTLTVTAAYTDASGQRVAVPLAYQSSTASTSMFTAAIAAPTGDATGIFVTASGAGFARNASTGIYLPNGAGSVGRVHGDTLIDTNHDGVADAIAIPVAVTTAQAGTYQLTVDLAAGTGANAPVVASGAGSATLPAGGGDITVTVPLSRLLATRAASGSFEVVNGALTQGTSGRTLVARAADMGATNSYNLDTYSPTTPVLSRPVAASLDTNNDGFYDTLQITAAANVATAGSYRLTGTLYAPNGAALTQISQSVSLQTGRNPLTVNLDGTLIGATGPGIYQVRGLTLTSATDPSRKATSGTVMIGPLDDSQWIGTTPNAPTLSRLWDEAQAAGAISRYGLYMSEHNRLTRVVNAAAAADTVTEAAQLDTFIADINANTSVIDDSWRTRIAVYATALRGRI